MKLDLAAAVDEVDERRLAVAPPGRDSPGDSIGVLGLLARLELVVGGVDVADLNPAIETVRKRLDPVGAQAVELLSPFGEDVGL